MLILRSLLSFFLVITFVYSFQVLPLAITNIIFNTNSYFSVLLAYFFLGEKASKKELLAVFGVFIGICLIFLGKEGGEEEQVKYKSYLLLPFFAAFMMSGLSVINRYLKELDPQYVQFWFAITGLFFTVPLDLVQLIQGEPVIGSMSNKTWSDYTINQYVVSFVLIGPIMYLASFCFIAGFQRAKTASLVFIC